MSLCFRTIPNKFTSFVNTRKQITKIDQKLPQNVKPSSFLDEFLGLQTSVDTKLNLFERNLDIFVNVNPSHQKRLLTSTKSFMICEGTLLNIYVKDEKKSLHAEQRNLTNHHRFKSVKLLSVTDFPLYNITIDCEEKINNSSKKNIFTASSDIDNLIHNNKYFFDKKSVTADTDSKWNINILTCGSVKTQEDKNNEQSIQIDEGRPTRNHLEHIFNCLSRDLPKFFVQPLDYSIYTSNVIFVNNIRGTTTTGILPYVKQLSFLRIIGHCKFAYVKLELLKITINPEDDSVKVRWRIRGITGMKVMFMFWKIKLWKLKEAINEADVWYDGFSTFYVDGNGKIYKHVADKMMPDKDQLLEKEKTPVVTKLAMFAGLKDLPILNSNEVISKLKRALMFNVK